MTVQDSYSLSIEKGYAGLLADINPIRTISGVVEETNGIGFGLGVIKGTNDKQVKLPSSDSDSLVGITIHSHVFENNADNVAIMADEQIASVLQEGSIYVQPEDSVTPASSVYCRYKEGEQVSTITFSGALTSGSIDLDVDGVALTSVAFNTSMAQTMADLGSQLTTDFPTKIQTTIVDGNTLEIISQASLNVVIDSIVVTTDPATGAWAVNRAYDADLTVGRFLSSDGSVAGVANTDVAFAVTALSYDETAAADGICKLRSKL